MLTTAYIINRTPSTILHGKTPYEVLFGTKPTYDHIKVFGHLCHAHNLQRQKDKFGPRSRKCVFTGYPCGKKGWRVYDVEHGDIFVSQGIIFCEEIFPFSKEIEEQDHHHPKAHDLPMNVCVENEDLPNISTLCPTAQAMDDIQPPQGLHSMNGLTRPAREGPHAELSLGLTQTGCQGTPSIGGATQLAQQRLQAPTAPALQPCRLLSWSMSEQCHFQLASKRRAAGVEWSDAETIVEPDQPQHG